MKKFLKHQLRDWVLETQLQNSWFPVKEDVCWWTNEDQREIIGARDQTDLHVAQLVRQLYKRDKVLITRAALQGNELAQQTIKEMEL